MSMINNDDNSNGDGSDDERKCNEMLQCVESFIRLFSVATSAMQNTIQFEKFKKHFFSWNVGNLFAYDGQCQERFQRFGSTISRSFGIILEKVSKLAIDIIESASFKSERQNDSEWVIGRSVRTVPKEYTYSCFKEEENEDEGNAACHNKMCESKPDGGEIETNEALAFGLAKLSRMRKQGEYLHFVFWFLDAVMRNFDVIAKLGMGKRDSFVRYSHAVLVNTNCGVRSSKPCRGNTAVFKHLRW
ncbi:hypothetical protein Gotur_028856 [Gossypium turneri]